jgi:hypothetical protein
MLTLDQKIRKWSRKVNRNKTFTPIELEEMEDHLLVEIKQMVQYDKLTEEEAFNKATETLGEHGILDVEYGKIRWSAFSKVKFWAYLQTFVILGLVLVLMAPYLHFPMKNRNGFVMGREIGEISKWAYEGSKNSASSFVPYKNEVYFYNHDQGNIYSYMYSPHDFVTIKLILGNSYFAPSPSLNCSGSFDIDSNKDFYFLEDYEKSITVYRDTKKIKSIQLPKNLSSKRIEGFKVIETKLIELATYKLETENVYKEIDDCSSLFIYDLLSRQPKWEIIKLKNVALSIVRSKDEVAILYIDGEIEIYTLQNQKLMLIETKKIIDFPKFLTNHRVKPKDSLLLTITTKLDSFKNSLLSVFKPKKSRFWK